VESIFLGERPYHRCNCSRRKVSGAKICSCRVDKCKVGKIVNLSLSTVFTEMKQLTNQSIKGTTATPASEESAEMAANITYIPIVIILGRDRILGDPYCSRSHPLDTRALHALRL